MQRTLFPVARPVWKMLAPELFNVVRNKAVLPVPAQELQTSKWMPALAEERLPLFAKRAPTAGHIRSLLKASVASFCVPVLVFSIELLICGHVPAIWAGIINSGFTLSKIIVLRFTPIIGISAIDTKIIMSGII